MKKATIIQSHTISDDTIEVVWSDGVRFYFNSKNLNDQPVIVPIVIDEIHEKALRQCTIISQTSARVTLNGCSVNA